MNGELVSNCLAKRVFDMRFGCLCCCFFRLFLSFWSFVFVGDERRRTMIHRDNNDPNGMKMFWHLFCFVAVISSQIQTILTKSIDL